MFENDMFTILNYQGSKKQILDFIFQNIKKLTKTNGTILDLFAGSGAVSYSLKRYYKVYSNDVEYYSYIINEALMSKKRLVIDRNFKEVFYEKYMENLTRLKEKFFKNLELEEKFINYNSKEELVKMYLEFPNMWKNKACFIENIKVTNPNDLRMNIKKMPYILTTLYYSTTYFSLKQAIELDSLRYAIEFTSKADKNKYLASLFYTIKEIVFSKDGHMAQPLDVEKNFLKLKKIFSKNTYEIFMTKLEEFGKEEFVETLNENKVYNLEYKEMLKIKNVINEVDTLYLDPPYTDMQYSRYYHLLNVIAKYDYPNFSYFRGKITKGLYTEDRFQSSLSKKVTALTEIKKIVKLAYENKKNIIISFAYPQDTKTQATNRYVFSLSDLITIVQDVYKENIRIEKVEYKHSNNRNSTTKNVFEYLIIGVSKDYVN